jgi:Cu/Ag efflux protein CusF
MEDVIETYMLPLDDAYPVVCFDESPFQLMKEVREPIAAKTGQPRREDYEYARCGVVEAMMICQPAAGLRKCMVMEHRKKADFAAVCKEIDRMFPEAKKITLVCDNLNTHTMGALYAAFPAQEARRLAKRIEIRHTPKHGSWLNIAELEFAVLGRTVFKKRIKDKEQLQRELDAICGQRNAEGKPVRWQFNLGKAREKMAWPYPKIVNESD